LLDAPEKNTNAQRESQRAIWQAGYRCHSLDSIKTALFNIEHDKSLRIMVALPCS
jgi:hypothetical protein